MRIWKVAWPGTISNYTFKYEADRLVGIAADVFSFCIAMNYEAEGCVKPLTSSNAILFAKRQVL
jgi:hypothetical protein